MFYNKKCSQRGLDREPEIVPMTGGIMHTPSHTNVCNFFNFQLTFTPEMLKLGRVTKVKGFFLVLVYVFNIDLFEFSAAILEKGLLA